MRLLVIKPEPLARRLLKLAGTTYAAEAGIRIRDKPMPLFQLLVLCMLASKPIGAATAARAARELFCSGLRTPKAVLSAERQTMISAFGRAHYVRYDESSATRLTAIAHRVRDEYSGDLRELAQRTRPDVSAAKRMLKTFNGIGDTGPTFSYARSKTSGSGYDRISTIEPPPRRSSSACPLTRRSWRRWHPAPMRCSLLR